MKYDDIMPVADVLKAVESGMRSEVLADSRVQAAKAEVMAAEERLSRVYREAMAKKKLETLKELSDEEQFEATLAQAVSNGWSAEEIILTRKYLLETSLDQILKPVPGPARLFPSMDEPIFARPEEIDK